MVLWAFFAEVVPDFQSGDLVGLVALYGYLAAFGMLLLGFVLLAARLRPPYRLPFFLVLPTALLFAALTFEQSAPLVLLVSLGGLSLLFGASTSVLSRRTLRSGSTIWLVVGAGALGIGAYEWFAPPQDLNPALETFHLHGHTIELPDPGTPGPYRVETFTYGSGHDRTRPQYNHLVRYTTPSVDASRVYPEWRGLSGWFRTRYWGFDVAHLPLQARVWMPVGRGPFPLVLIVHGNHLMKKESEAGYAYLGEHLASQGFILVSIDENFLNSGGADPLTDPLQTNMGKEMPARAWLLLEHLSQWRRWTADPMSSLHGKADMNRIALIGHSRGGEAVVLANAFNEMDAFPGNASIPFDFHFHIRAIVGIAPCEADYKPRSSYVRMRDQNYFVMAGSRDGDNGTSFQGETRYSRVSFSGAVDAFKASLYIKDANHGQFNTVWGRNDGATVYGFLTDERAILSGSEQRRIAKVYLTAFLEATLEDRRGYRALFQDPRNGAAWLPDDFLVANYADARTHWLATFEEDADPTTGTDPNVRISGHDLGRWREDDIDLKLRKLGTHVVLLDWNRGARARADPSYTITFRHAVHASEDSALVFSASQMPDRSDDAAIDWTISLTDAAGRTARLPLSHDQVLYPPVKGETHRLGSIGPPLSEPVMRRYRFALRDFVAEDTGFDSGELKQITFVFDRSPRGHIALDDVGLETPR